MNRTERIAMIRRHVTLGERHVVSQRAVIDRLTALGTDTNLAEDLLEEFEASLAEHRRHLAQLLEHES